MLIYDVLSDLGESGQNLRVSGGATEREIRQPRRRGGGRPRLSAVIYLSSAVIKLAFANDNELVRG